MDDRSDVELLPAWHSELRLSLGLFALGALPAEDASRVWEHLAGCAACRVRSAEFAQVIGALDLLTEEEVRGLTGEFGVITAEAVAEVAAFAETAAVAKPVQRGQRSSTRPPGTAGRRRWEDARGRARIGWLAGIGGLVVVVALTAGVLLGVTLGPSVPEPAATATLALTGNDSRTGASLSVFVSGRPNAAIVNATVVGLPRGTVYQLYAVTTAGRTYVVGRWVSSAPVQSVAGQVPVDTGALAFFAVAGLNGAPVVSAQILRPDTRSGTAQPS